MCWQSEVNASRVRAPWLCLLLGRIALLAGLLAGWTGCGGGSSGTVPPPPPAPDFTLSAAPTSLSLAAGTSASVSLTATGLNGFNNSVKVTLSGLPSGVTASMDSVTLTPGVAQQVTLNAGTTISSQSGNATFTGTSGSLSHTANVALQLTASVGVAPLRTRYVRTDSTTQYPFFVNQHWAIYHAATKRFFVTDPFSNRVTVMDAVTETEIGNISVPRAYSLDDTPDHGTLYVGTLLGDVYTLDPVTMTVTRRYLSSELGSAGLTALVALVLSDGRLALQGISAEAPSLSRFTTLGFWNPVDNSLVYYGAIPGGHGLPLPCGPDFGDLSAIERSADRRTIYLAGSSTLCVMDAMSGTGNYAAVGASPNHIALSPDGKYVAFPSSTGSAELVDTATLSQIAVFPVLGDTSNAASFVFSADSRTLYTQGDGRVYAYSVSSHQLTGWATGIYLPTLGGGLGFGPLDGPNLSASDGAGLFVGPMEEGVGFVDLSTLLGGTPDVGNTNAFLDPAFGPAAGGTVVNWVEPPATVLGDVYFGGVKAPSASVSSGTGIVTATTPAGQPGPVTVYAFTKQGGAAIIPDAFSYGPSILQVTPDMATAEGGGTGHIYGYGFGSRAGGIPPDLKVMVGGVSVPVVGFDPDPYGVVGQPFQLESVAFTIPSGAAGPVDVSVVNSSGTATAKGSLTYMPALQTFALPGKSIAQGIYDPRRDVYYFTDAHQVLVFSRTLGSFLAPIPIPAPSGGSQRLWSIALSHDGNLMAIGDAAAEALYVLDPDVPSVVSTFPVYHQTPGIVVNAAGLVVTNGGIVYYTARVSGGSGFDQTFELDTHTGIGAAIPAGGTNLSDLDRELRLVLSADETKLFGNVSGVVYYLDTATNRFVRASYDAGGAYGNYELVMAPNQTRVFASDFLYDANLNDESVISVNYRELADALYVYGAKLSSDGRLLFQPSVQGIDVFDGYLGNLRERISLPFPLGQQFDALVSDGRDNILVAITGVNGDGIAVVDLNSLPEPNPLPYAVTGPVRAGVDQAASVAERHSSTNHAPAQTPAGISNRPRHVQQGPTHP